MMEGHFCGFRKSVFSIAGVIFCSCDDRTGNRDFMMCRPAKKIPFALPVWSRYGVSRQKKSIAAVHLQVYTERSYIHLLTNS